jgi:hypothetical protein
LPEVENVEVEEVERVETVEAIRGYNKGTGFRSGETLRIDAKASSSEERCAVDSQPRGSAFRWSPMSYLSKFI